MKDLRTIVNGIAKLKPASQVLNKIVAITQDPESSMKDLSHIVSYDAAVTANILRKANSSYYGRSGQFESVHQAIVFLGMDEVVDLALMASSADNMKQHGQKGYDLKPGELWRYSVISALVARDLAAEKKIEDKHLVFTAAMLKDIGKVILEQYVSESLEQINLLVKSKQYSFREAEKEVLGIDHAELGGLVAKVWQFSPKMIDIIANHHKPDEAKLAPFETAVVYIADVVCMMMGIAVGCDGLTYRFHRDVVENLALSEKDFQHLMVWYSENLRKVDALAA